MVDERTCFIIMPITTPDQFAERYRDGPDHFRHVLQCLFLPAVSQAGYEPIEPIAKGADLIHAEIVKNLEASDLVLCDMSCLNPNVFFEFGIRTALNRPVCVVKDEHTKRVPFDTGILNHHEYKSTIEPWELPTQIDLLAGHLTESAERSGITNALWKYFGLKTEAQPVEGATADADKLDYLVMRLDSIQESLRQTAASRAAVEGRNVPDRDPENEAYLVRTVLGLTLGVPSSAFSISPAGAGGFDVFYKVGTIPQSAMAEAESACGRIRHSHQRNRLHPEVTGSVVES